MFKVILREQTPKVPFMKDAPAWLASDESSRYLRAFIRFLEDLGPSAVGLAANQAEEVKTDAAEKVSRERVMHRFFAYREEGSDKWDFFFNPKIIGEMGEPVVKLEGCLTWPGKAIKALRYPEILVNYVGMDGKQMHCRKLIGLEAQVWQHEVNHLDGVPEVVVEVGGKTVKYMSAKVGRNDPCPFCLEQGGTLVKWKKCKKHNIGRI